MFAARRHRSLTAWLALVAMLAFALMPTVSRALALGAGGNAWAEICTSSDTDRAAAGGGDPAPLQAAHHLDHCAFCSLAGAGALPLSVTPPALLLPLGSTLLPRLFLQAPHTLHAWRSAQPRGPPGCA